MRTRLLALLAGLLCALGLAGCATGSDAVAKGGQYQFVAPHGKQILFYDPPSDRGTLTALSGPSLTTPGAQVRLSDFPNQVVVINLWGSWCGPCRAEADDLQQLYQTTRTQGMTVLGVDLRDEQSDALDFARDHKLTYPLIYDQAGRSLTALNGYPRNVVPSTILLDRRHRVAAVYLQAVRISQIGPVVQRLLHEAPDVG
jgi:peroxiredoxin